VTDVIGVYVVWSFDPKIFQLAGASTAYMLFVRPGYTHPVRSDNGTLVIFEKLTVN
jgi:hypothetical protein